MAKKLSSVSIEAMIKFSIMFNFNEFDFRVFIVI